MLATFGLERLETDLNRRTVSAGDVAKFLEEAGDADVSRLARDGMSYALDRLNQRLHERESAGIGPTVRTDLPTGVYIHRAVNPEFQRTPHAYRV
jgi:hypothetical protein